MDHDQWQPLGNTAVVETDGWVCIWFSKRGFCAGMAAKGKIVRQDHSAQYTVRAFVLGVLVCVPRLPSVCGLWINHRGGGPQ
ncbi:hypothetical protein D3C79_688860 [compost metagenome]